MRRCWKVLVVDDDPVFLGVIEEALREAGHDVHTLDRALGTSMVLLQERPDVVLLDVEMPGLKGDQLLGVIRGRILNDSDWQPRFFFVSSHDATTLSRLVDEAGADGAIEKAGGPEAVVAQLEARMRG